jgi:hypothetical protein
MRKDVAQMKNSLLISAALLSGICSAQLVAASLSCKPLAWKPHQRDGKIFTFEVSSDCVLSVDQELIIASIKNSYEDNLEKDRSYNIVSRDESLQVANMNGMQLWVQESRRTPHGSLQIAGTIKLLDDGANRFIYDYTSSSMNGSSNAKYTEYERFTVEVSKIDAIKYRVLYTQVTKVRKPTLAPESTLVSKVKEGITQDIGFRANQHAQVIAKQ